MTMKAIKYRHLLRGVAVLLALLSVFAGTAQPQETLDAYRAYQQQDYSGAAELINSALKAPGGESDAMTWHIRGFIYKDIFNTTDHKDRNSANRPEAVESFFRSMELDAKNEFRDNNLKSLRYLASSYYNDAVLVMREVDENTIAESEELYKKYKEIAVRIESDVDTVERDITFYKALATCHRKIYEQDRDANKDYLYKALANYQYVLQLDPENYGANYNTAINLYNEGAYGIEQIDAEAKIPTIVKVQAGSIDLFREALPFLLKAYEQDSTRKETLIALRGIYLSLNNNEEANKYRDLLQQAQQTNNE